MHISSNRSAFSFNIYVLISPKPSGRSLAFMSSDDRPCRSPVLVTINGLNFSHRGAMDLLLGEVGACMGPVLLGGSC